MPSGKRCWVAAVALSVIVLSCSTSDTEQVCTPGQAAPCPCPDGRQGTRTCLPDGTGYGPCEGCGGAGGGGGTAGSGAVGGTAGAGGAMPCANGIVDGDESDVDCGGADCPACLNGFDCRDYSDCVSQFCRVAGGAGGSGGALGGSGGAGGSAGSPGGAGGAGGAAGGTGGSAPMPGVCWPCEDHADCLPAAPDTKCDDDGVCIEPAQLADGQPCTDEIDCLSGHCVDGVCCAAAACAECQACNLSGTEGTCAPTGVGSPCGDGICDQCDNSGACVPSAPGVAGPGCNDTNDDDCDNPDTCDGTGSCQTNLESNGTPCGAGLTEPVCNPDACDGAGTCVDNPVAGPGTVCDTGNPAGDADCDNGDFCDGAGTCLDDYVAGGSACGPGLTEPVCDPDTCDGAGTCVDVAEPGAGTPCGAGLTEPVCDPDACDGAGTCVDNPVAGPGTVCDTGNPAGDADCDNGDLCDGGGTCLDDYVAGGTFCGAGIAEPICNPDACDGFGTCLDVAAAPDSTPCTDDLLYCTGAETCSLGVCGSVGDPCTLPQACNEWLDACGANVWINEIHYDDVSTDDQEGVEIAAAAGTDLAGWSLVFYNGNGGATYDTLALSGTLPDQEDGYGTLFFSNAGIQNGSPDAVALVDDSGQVVQFLSYEGSFTAVGGPADGLVSVNIGVAETTSTPDGHSLQLIGAGKQYHDFAWRDPATKNYSTSPDVGWAGGDQCFGIAYTGNLCFTGISAVGLDFTQAAQFCTAKGPGNHLCTAAEYAVLESAGGWPIAPWPPGATHGWVDGGPGDEAGQYSGFSQAGALDDWPHSSATGFSACCKARVDPTCNGVPLGNVCYQGAGIIGDAAKVGATLCDAQGYRLCTAAEARLLCDGAMLPDLADSEHFWVDGSEGDQNQEWPGLLDANHSTNGCDVASWPESDTTGVPLCCQTTAYRGHPDLCAGAGGTMHAGVCLTALLSNVDYSNYVSGCFGLGPGSRPCSVAEGRLACVDGAFAAATVWVDGAEGSTNLEWVHLLSDCSNSDAPDTTSLTGACCY